MLNHCIEPSSSSPASACSPLQWQLIQPDISNWSQPAHSWGMAAQSLWKPEQLPWKLLGGSGACACQTKFQNAISNLSLMGFATPPSLTRDMFCLELLVHSDWWWTVMKGGSTQGVRDEAGEKEIQFLSFRRENFRILLHPWISSPPCINVSLNT